MEPLVVYIFDHAGGYQSMLEDQLDAAKVDRLPVSIPVLTWRNRAIKTMEIAREYPDRLLFFVDAWDTFLGTKDEVQSPLWAKGVGFASQKRCWPDPVTSAISSQPMPFGSPALYHAHQSLAFTPDMPYL